MIKMRLYTNLFSIASDVNKKMAVYLITLLLASIDLLQRFHYNDKSLSRLAVF